MSLSRSRFAQSLSSLGLAAVMALGIVAAPTSAETVSTHGTICNGYGSVPAQDLFYTESGVWNNNATISRGVICSIPRVPFPGGSQAFIVEGTNAAGKATPCSMLVFSSVGTLLASRSFNSSTVTYSRTIVFPAAELPNGAYVNLICFLPINRGGYLRGVVAI